MLLISFRWRIKFNFIKWAVPGKMVTRNTSIGKRFRFGCS